MRDDAFSAEVLQEILGSIPGDNIVLSGIDFTGIGITSRARRKLGHLGQAQGSGESLHNPVAP
jgi:hypothetical protein